MLAKRHAGPGVACLKGNVIVVAGGLCDGNYLSTVERLSKDAENDSRWTTAWKQLAPMNQARGFFQLAEFRGNLIAAGGWITEKPNKTLTSSVEIFQPSDATDPDGPGLWTRITNLTRPLEIQGCILSPITPNEIYAFGKVGFYLIGYSLRQHEKHCVGLLVTFEVKHFQVIDLCDFPNQCLVSYQITESSDKLLAF